MAKSSTVTIPTLSDDPEFSAADRLLTLFDRKLRWLDDKITLLGYEQQLAKSASSSSQPEQKENFRRLIEDLRFRTADAADQSGSIQSGEYSPEIAAGLAVVRGEDVMPVPNVAEQLAKLHQDREVISAAIAAQEPIVEEIRGRKRFELASLLVAANDALLVAHFRAAQELARTVAAVRDLHTRWVAAGYGMPRYDLTPAPLSRGALLLGDETDSTSEISQLRRFLAERGSI